MANKRNLSNVNIGTSPNSGDGDLLRDAFAKINDNFANIYGNGQFLANVSDNRGAPGYSWEDDKNTGLYNPEDGVIIVSLNGTDSLHMRSNGYIAWRGDKLIGNTEFYAALQNVSSSGGGGSLEFVETLPLDFNFEGRFVLNAQDGQLYLYQNDAWILLKNQLAPDAPSGVEFVNSFPTTNLWEGRLVIRNNFAWVYRQGAWVKIQDVADIDETYSKIEKVDTLPNTDLFEGRTAFQNEGLYIYYNGQWRAYGDFVSVQAGSVELAGSIKLWAGANAPNGWHICDGTAVSRTVYSTLFSRIGTTYGNGNGTTTFNLPDFRNRTAFGVSSSKSIGSVGGFADAVVVSHSHTVTDPGHNHVPSPGEDNAFNQALQVSNPSSGTIVQVDGISYPQPNLLMSGDIANATTGISIVSSGVSGTGRNLPPYTAVNWIIKLDDGTITGEGGVTSSGLFFNIEVYRRSAVAVSTPTGGSFNFGTLVLTPPSQWSRTIPTGTDPVYVSKAIAYATNTSETVTNLTWSTPVIAFRDGAASDGIDGVDGPRNSSGYLFYNTLSAEAPTPPSSTTGYSFSTGSFSFVTSGWSETLPNVTSESGKKQWAVRYYVAEGTFGGAQSLSLSAVFPWQNFDGLVTFTNFSDAFDNNITTIDGGKITTGTIEADKIRTGTATLNNGSFSLGDENLFGRPIIGKFYTDSQDGWGLGAIKSVDPNTPFRGAAFLTSTNAPTNFASIDFNIFRPDGGRIDDPTGGASLFYRSSVESANPTIPIRLNRWGSWSYTTEKTDTEPNNFGSAFLTYGNQTLLGCVPEQHYAAFVESTDGSRDDWPLRSWYNYQTVGGSTINAFFTIKEDLVNTKTTTPVKNGTVIGDFAGYGLYVYSDVTGLAPKAYIEGGVEPFTGIHQGAMASIINVQIGDIVVDDEKLFTEDFINVRFKQVLSTESEQKGVIGVVTRYLSLEDTQKRVNDLKYKSYAFDCTQFESEPDEDYEIRKAKEKEIYDAGFMETIKDLEFLPENLHYIDIAAVGEGQINVCGEGGNIQRGDLIVTSSIPGKGMKQADDVVRAYTVAKARESVTFDTPNQIRTIACVYLCG